MPIPILMPALSPTMTEGNIATWIKKVGENIKPGDIIAEVETDKATMEVEAIDEGKLASIIFEDGTENVTVNSLIGVISQDKETEEDIKIFIENFGNNNDKKSVASTHTDSIKNNNDELVINNNQESTLEKTIINESKNNQKSVIEKTIINETKTNQNKNIKTFISPLARRIADMKNIDTTNLKGSGPHGRIIKKDLDIYLDNKADLIDKGYKDNTEITNEETEIKLSNIRKTIASRLQESKQTIPHFYLKININMDNIIKAREEINKFLLEDNNDRVKISYNDIFIKATAEALNKVPEMNAIWNNSSILRYNNVDISVAVATEEGLFTPVIRNANNKKLITISKEMKNFIKKAREKSLLPKDYTGGSFSISNLGMYDVEEFSAIINPPQSGILAIGAIKEELMLVNDKVIRTKNMTFTLSVDHRIADGAIASKLLKYIKFYLNNPIGMLI